MSITAGVLYIVATPIGNLGDLSQRAVRVLNDVDRILAEDTRHTRTLLNHYGIRTTVTSMHEHNEKEMVIDLLDRLQNGMSMAVVSDAGTPLISDPGFPLVREARRRGFKVSPIPGASALISALSASGLACNRFVFEGFPPRNSGRRRALFTRLATDSRTIVFFESSHRCQDTLRDLRDVMGADREAVLAREVTKVYETFIAGTLAELVERLREDPKQTRGEFVLMVSGAPQTVGEDHFDEGVRVMTALSEELPVKRAAALAAKITGARRNDLYRHALQLRDRP